jgi:uncharacterized protein YndB with AHSA1/START domain
MTNKLKIHPQGEREIVMTRAFDAPRKMVFDAYTKPELIRRWLGAMDGWQFDVCEVDLREGGKYRWVWRSSDGSTMGMGGVYREISAPDRLVCTEQFDDSWYEGEGLITATFVETAAKTMLTVTMRYESTAARDGVLASPMESGVSASYDKLEDMLAAGG